MCRSAVRAIAALAVWLGAAGAAGAAPALWRVSDADSQIYLFGTIHALKSDRGWRTPLYERVLGDAGTVWFETDLSSGDPDTIRLLVQRYGVDPDRPLSRKLAPTDLDALARQADLRRIDHLRPWVAALMLSMQPTVAKGASVEKGADVTVTRTVQGSPKRIRTFETMEDQVRMFASLPEPSEVRYLADVIHERSGAAPRRRFLSPPPSLEAAWRTGDLVRIGSRLAAQMKTANPPLYEALLRRRNLAWADALTAEMAGSGIELVNVGALHLVGDDGLPALLAARGFRVERVQ